MCFPSQNSPETYGLYPGKQLHDVNQVPLEFSKTRKRSYNDKNKGKCWIVGSKVDMEKRQAPLQLCFCAEAPQKTEDHKKNFTKTEDHKFFFDSILPEYRGIIHIT